jgi:hypothetical protein
MNTFEASNLSPICLTATRLFLINLTVSLGQPSRRKEHSHAVATDAKITLEGKECKLEDLKKGYQITVTTEKRGDKTTVTKIDATKAI